MATTEAPTSHAAPLAPGDLPDPLDMPTKTPPSADADELISQLASNQIDKMLADANIEKPNEVEAEADESVDEVSKAETESIVTEPAAEVDDRPPVAEEHSAETTADEMSQIFSDEPSSMDRAPQGDAHQVEEALASVQSAAEELARELEADAAVSPRRQQSKSTTSEVAHHEPQANVGMRVGFGVLNAINAPFKNLSDNTRELFGSIAIITLVNAMSILLYVMIYR